MKFRARSENRNLQLRTSLLPSTSKYRQGITAMIPTGYRVAAPKPESRPTRKSSCHDWDLRSFNENQMTKAHKKLLKM
jgi:hypothetical protein